MRIDFESYYDNGFLVVQQLLEKELIVDLRMEANRILRAAELNSSTLEGPQLHNILSSQSGSSQVAGLKSLHVEHVFRFSALFNELIHDNRLTSLAQSACDQNLSLLDDQLYWKPANIGGPTYIHRDSDFFGPLRVVTVWIPLVDVDEINGCLWAVPGSHCPDVELEGLAKRTAQPNDTLPDRRPFDYFYEVDWERAGFQPLPMQVGDVLLLHHNNLHCSLETCGDRERLSYLAEYMATADVEQFRDDCSGVFDYHDRYRYMEPITDRYSRSS